MKDILDELYYYLEEEPSEPTAADYKRVKMFEKLTEILGKKEKELLLKYDSALNDYWAEASREDFKRGYRLCFRRVFGSLLHE
ncbi:MAG: hypothetical protein FWE74_08915 [Oscillospiraceae bacterium]|nr:hypothetical protein [Oscillospiraceae bacterium]